MQTVYLGIGTNLGDKLQNLNDCIELLKTRAGEILKISSVYETEPWGVNNQENYLNLVVELTTQLYPLELLKVTQEIEISLGRKKTIKWESRVIDIDILLYADFHFSIPNLTIPHSYLCQRNFVVFPLYEIASTQVHPVLRLTISQIKDNIKDDSWIKRIDKMVL